MSAVPLPVRILAVAGWVSLAASIPAFVLGGILRANDVGKVLLVFAGMLLTTAILSLLGTRRSPWGLVAAAVACALLIVAPPFGTMTTIAIALVASQTWPQIRDYYGQTRGTA